MKYTIQFYYFRYQDTNTTTIGPLFATEIAQAIADHMRRDNRVPEKIEIRES